ncbi:TPA: hypothetical protein ACH3X1_012591 [Trebouxia sp. C0004]
MLFMQALHVSQQATLALQEELAAAHKAYNAPVKRQQPYLPLLASKLRGWAEGTRVGPPLFMSPTSAPGSSSGRSMSSASSSLQFAPGSQEAHPANQVQGEMQEARQQPDSRQHAPQEWQAKEAQPAPTLAAPPQGRASNQDWSPASSNHPAASSNHPPASSNHPSAASAVDTPSQFPVNQDPAIGCFAHVIKADVAMHKVILMIRASGLSRGCRQGAAVLCQ